MSFNSSKFTNKLDFIRTSEGVNECKNMFKNLANKDKSKAINLINADDLTFTSLFVLRHEIYKLNLVNQLNNRNQIALNICDIIGEEKYSSIDYDNKISLKSDVVHDSLLWMFNTGNIDDGLSEEFEQILDTVASVLIKEHHEKEIIPVMVEMIFKRNNDNRNIHDLAWACFKSKDITVLQLLAQKLRSPNAKDVKLSRSLLNLSQDKDFKNDNDKQKEYSSYIHWLKENNPYITFTDESFNFSNRPVPLIVDLDSKYLCTGGVVQTSTHSNKRNKKLDKFDKLPQNDKALLANYSHQLHKKNLLEWNNWMKSPLEKQLQIAKNTRRYSI